MYDEDPSFRPYDEQHPPLDDEPPFWAMCGGCFLTALAVGSLFAFFMLVCTVPS